MKTIQKTSKCKTYKAFTSKERLLDIIANWDYHIIKVKGTSYNNIKLTSLDN
jgi:hypothetical protein